MRSVLGPMDGSAGALEALRATVRLGPAAIERIELLNVQPRFHRHISQWVPRWQRDGWRRERAERALLEARRVLRASTIPWREHHRIGPLAATIDRVAAQLRCDEVVGPVRPLPLERYAIPAGLGLTALLLLAD